MHIEVLSEDRSGAVVLEQLLPRIIQGVKHDFRLYIRPHRGKGDVPQTTENRPSQNATGLLDLLPAKLRAYDRVYAERPFVLAVVVDADNDDVGELRAHLTQLTSIWCPSIRHVIGISIEEMEAWLLGDGDALFKAYPYADREMWERYEQDSICGTWEHLARVILGSHAKSLIRVGYPAVGQYKQAWARAICPHMRPENNRSPSFKQFEADILKAVAATDKGATT